MDEVGVLVTYMKKHVYRILHKKLHGKSSMEGFGVDQGII
jgi:hypothetical protein